MIVKCTDCNASYSVDDAKVRNKKFGFTCPKCGANVIIDNRNLNLSEQIVPSLEISAHKTQKAETIQKTSVHDDYMDFDLSGDDEALLKKETKEKHTSIGIADLSSGDKSELFDDSMNLNDIGSDSAAISRSTVHNEHDFIVEKETNLDEISFNDLPSDATTDKSTRIAVDEEDFKPLEEDFIEENTLSEDYPDLVKESPEISLDSLEKETIVKGEPSQKPSAKPAEMLSSSADVDESITIDLDTLDIQLDESSAQEIGKGTSEDIPEDESITLDLDSLDITLDEAEEYKEGISIEDEDERLTLEDAGISLDQLETKKQESEIDSVLQDNEEELTLSLNEISPSLEKEIIHDKKENYSSIVTEIDENELPEIDFDKLQSDLESEKSLDATLSISPTRDSKTVTTPIEFDKYLEIETGNEFEQYKLDIERYASEEKDTIPYGAINFSIDYSLTHSRLKAFLRLIGLYYIIFIPHIIVLSIYSILSTILAFLNWFIVLLYGSPMEDFLELQANTLRYAISLISASSATTDDLPTFAGRKNIDHSIQVDFIFPSKPSRILAALRLSFIGIIIISLPHYLIAILLSIGMLFISILSFISIIVSKRLPNIFFDFMVRYFRYLLNIIGFHIGLIDKYPSFRFE